MTPIRTAAEYGQAMTIVNAIIDMIGGDEDHPLAEALDLISNQADPGNTIVRTGDEVILFAFLCNLI